MTWSECEQILISTGRNIRRHRLALGLTQDELAKRTKIFSRTSIVNVEAGRQKLTILTLVAVARSLGVNPSDLLQEYKEDRVEVTIAGKTMLVPSSVAEALMDSADAVEMPQPKAGRVGE